jgi:nitrous oxidase accessory protein
MHPVRLAVMIVTLAALSARAEEIVVPAGPDTLTTAVAAAALGDVLKLEEGVYPGPLTLDRPLTIDGQGQAVIDGGGKGTVITITGEHITLRGLTVRGSGLRHQEIDSAIKLVKGARDNLIENIRVEDSLHGIDVHGATGTVARNNVIIGRQDARMTARGNGFYVWNAPGTVIENNIVRYGRDGIFTNASKDDVFRNNLFRDLRFAVHYMYTHNSEVSGNISVGNHLGYAIMYSNRVKILDNLSLGDRNHGVMLNYANNADVSGNLVRGGAHKCTFIYNAHRNLIWGNRFEGCDIGIHFTAGSERNAMTGNAFIGNRTQVKYVGTRDIEWSVDGKGNFWSDHPAFDLNGDGIADSPFRPNDLMDHILWSQPAASLLMGSPAVQLIRWSQASFPATLPGGVVDSHPQMAPVEIPVPPEIAAMEAEVAGRWPKDTTDDTDSEDLSSH